MSAGGDGVIDVRPLTEIARPAFQNLSFIARRFKPGGRLEIADSPNIIDTPLITCVLCGGLVIDGEQNFEHPLPQWLHRFAGDEGNRKAPAFAISETSEPTWRQLCLTSHKRCNTEFARKLEDPVVSAIKALVEGRLVTWQQLDAVFDWLDKIRSSSAHMATALRGHAFRVKYDEISFPNARVGAFDRLALLFTITEEKYAALNLWDALSEWFLTTPTAIALCIKDLVIISVSSNYLLSDAFGLGTARVRDGVMEHTPGSGKFSMGFGTRCTRIHTARIIAQPMRRQDRKRGFIDNNSSLQVNGDGWIYQLVGSKWSRIKSINLSTLPKISRKIGITLATLELVEWIIICKEQDDMRYPPEVGRFFMGSLPDLLLYKQVLLNQLATLRGGLRVPESDRPHSL